MSIGIQLSSDYTDYYDDELKSRTVTGGNFLYTRNQNTASQRALDLKFLKANGITVPAIKVTRAFQDLPLDTPLLVYTHDTYHNGTGKIVLLNNNAQDLYSGLAARQWYPNTETSGITLKCLQIGSRRFKLTLRAQQDLSVTSNILEDIQEINRAYSNLCKSPIYSIDYIPTSNGLLAIDFNQTENLTRLGIEKLIPASDIVTELQNFYKKKYE